MNDKTELLKRRQQLAYQLAELDEALNISTPVFTDWKKKAFNCIATNKRYMTTVDILMCVLGVDIYNQLEEKERKEKISLLSVTLSNLAKENHIGKARINGIKGNYYGLKSWFEVDGRMKNEYADYALHNFINETKMLQCCTD